jgi:hypothetical protein
MPGRGPQAVVDEEEPMQVVMAPAERGAGLASVMAPARIELAHADSKSAALSTELRGLGVRVDEVQRSFFAGRG